MKILFPGDNINEGILSKTKVKLIEETQHQHCGGGTSISAKKEFAAFS